MRLPNLEGQVPVFISPKNRVAQIYSRALGSLFSPLMTRRAKVEVFYLASTQDKGQVEVEVNLQPTVSRPVCLGAGIPSGSHDWISFNSLTIGFLDMGHPL
jgi:hypothetical protein